MTSSSEQRLPKSAIIEKAKTEARALNKIRRKLTKRQEIGIDWDGKAANDNIAWPLATALIKEGNAELLKYAMMYRKVHDTAKSEAKLGGGSVSIGDGMSLDRHIHIRESGQIAYKHVRKSDAAIKDIPARKKTQTDSDTQHSPDKVECGYTNVPKQWRGDDPVNSMIDAQSKLIILRRVLGHLCEPFELACIDGRTLEAVGNALGTANRSGAQGAGRAVIHMALITLRDFIGKVSMTDIAFQRMR